MAKTRSHSPNLQRYAQRPQSVRSPMESIGSLPEVLGAFRRATGWSLQYATEPESKPSAGLSWSAPVNPGVGNSLGHLRLAEVDSAEKPPVDWDSARALASALADMIGEFAEVRQSLCEREAELAAGVPLVARSAEDEPHLAVRLKAILRGGAEAVGCHAAALYLLDEATSKLKLRSCWGLPLDRLTAPARPLQGAVADLEALLGHAVVLDDPGLMREWNVPEDFAAMACVPVSSPATILGTLWVFSNDKRDFTPQQTNILEVVAGRVASDLEREMLWNEGLSGAELKTQVVAAERLQRNQLPSVAPMLDGWDMAGWTAQAGPLGGDFHDWFCLPDGLVAVALGHAMDRGIEAALATGALKAGLRAHGQYYREAQQTLKRLNLTLWTGSAGDLHASLFYGLIETATGRICCASAGEPGILLVRPGGWESLHQISPRLGSSPETIYDQYGYELQPGEAMVLFTEGVRNAKDAKGRSISEARFAETVRGDLDLSASDLLALLRVQLENSSASTGRRDLSMVVLKRRRN